MSNNVVENLELRHFAKIVESSDDAIVSKDLNGTIRSWNRSAERMFGYTCDEAIGRSIRMIVPADLQAEEDNVLARIRSGQMVDHFETRRRRKDGTEIQISLTVSPIFDDDGHVIGASKIARDITDRMRLRSAAAEHSWTTLKVSEVGATVASSLDQETIVQRVTDIATALTRAEFGAFFYNLIDPQSGNTYTLYTLSGAPKEAFAHFPHPRVTDIFDPTFHGHGVVRLDDVTTDPRYGQTPPHYGMPEGHLPVRSYLAVPVKSLSGEVLGGLFFGHATPGMFTVQHEQLVTGIAGWASLALENSRLYSMARDADRLKDEFLAVLSHELRTPLSAIVGYARLLRGGLLTGDKARRGLETLERNANSLTQIVEDVLDVSRIISGKLQLDIKPIDMGVLARNAIATVQPAADAKGIQLQAHVDASLGLTSGDPDRLQQVMWNLLANAVKFTPRDGRVDLRLERQGSHIEISVSDTGIGIAPDFVPHVFERFRQADASTTRKTGGLGLGLSIVRHIVEMHGGTVEAFSEGEDRGATFRVRMPLNAQVEKRSEARRQKIGERAAALTLLGNLTGINVLAIDDEPDALSLLQLVLESAGATVTTSSSATAALARIDELQPHVLIVDLGMPHMDGFEFIARVRNSTDPVIRDIPAAALTAFARSEDRTKALQSGFELHLAKPVEPSELVASVATLVRRTRRFERSPNA
jgi:PAS domain S-box-containing protein